jgi:beta-glucanase (GH16 family)
MQEEKMKRSVQMMIVMFIVTMWSGAYAQATRAITFSGGIGDTWNWVVENNDTNPALSVEKRIGQNNPGSKAGKFTALSTGTNRASFATLNNGEFTFSSTNKTVRIEVYKPVISNVVIRFEGSSPAAELTVANTSINTWQYLTLDFTPYIGNTYNKMIIILDNATRTQDNICWADNIEVPGGVYTPPPSSPSVAAPTPTNNQSDVISIWSDAFTNVTGVDPLVWWDASQTTQPSIVQIQGNNTLRYATLNFQGVDWNGNPQNVSNMEYLHVDVWTPNSTNLGVYLISGVWQVNQKEYEYPMGFYQGQWNSYDIPLSYFSGGGVDLTDARQFKFEGNGDVYLDNLYFWKTGSPPGEDARLSDLKIDGMTLYRFDSNTYDYSYEVPVWKTGVPAVTVSLNDPLASYQIFNASAVPGTTQVLVTAANGTTTQSYYVDFTSKGYTLLWADEFNSGTQPNPTYWSYDTGYGPAGDGWGNDEWQNYTNSVDNVKVQGGNLVISALCPSGTPAKRNGSVTSGRIKTLNKFDTRYGLLQARIKAPTGMGMWAAFWALGDNFETVGWPKCGELDVTEIAKHSFGTNTSLSAIHWSEDTAGDAWWYVSQTKDMGVDLSSDYHIYELDWEYDRVIAKIDGMPFFERQIGHIGMTEFVQRFFLLLNVAVGGTLGGAPDGTTVWPQNMFVDWVRVYELNNPTAPVVQAPIPPVRASGDVISIFSNAYTNITGVTLNPWWEGQETFIYMNYPIEPNDNLIYYENLNFAGIDWTANRQNVSGLDYLHVDFFTANATALSIWLISNNTMGATQQKEYVFNVIPHQWNSVNIPLSHFLPTVDLTRAIQFMITGNNEVWVDNLYFFKNVIDPATDATLSDLKVDGTTISGFNSLFYDYEYRVPFGTITVPTVTATTSNLSATKQIINAPSLPGTTEVAVTAQNGTTKQSYFVNFLYKPASGPTAPTHAPSDVISVYSDTYTDITPVNYNPSWGQSTIVTVDYKAGTDNVLFYDNLNYQGTDWSTIPQNVSAYNFLHVDFWADSNTDSLGIYLISTGPVEAKYNFTVTPHQWNSVGIPLTHFSAGGVDLTNAIQFKFEGNGDVWLDNLYFYKSIAPNAPTNVIVTTTATNVTVTWDAVSGATSYIVYSSTDPYGTFALDSSGSFTGTSWTAPFNGTKMFYYVKAVSSKAAKEVE